MILKKKVNIRHASLELIDPEFLKTIKLVEEMENKSILKKGSKKERKSILLIDEVDVFFSEFFYGKTFNPVVKF